MLSYQHIYHAGGPADLHKHSVLCAVLSNLRGRHRTLSYLETHAGRGLYDLSAPEAVKTGEAAQGWLKAAQDPAAQEKLPSALVKIIRTLNGCALTPLYPGSPMVAARMLRPQDRITVMELHPQEHKALTATFAGDARVTVIKGDGYEEVLKRVPPAPRHGLVLVDPSYEIKEEYRQAADFVVRLARRWPESVILLWYPLLPAKRHGAMLDVLRAGGILSAVNEYRWTTAESERGMYGSGMAIVNFFGDLPALA